MRPINIAQQNGVSLAEVEAVEFLGYQDVYNMEVEEDHCFSVNGGLIIHNCLDALRYFVRTKRLVKPKTHYVSVFEKR